MLKFFFLDKIRFLEQKLDIDISYYIKNGFWVLLGHLFVMSSSLLLSMMFARFVSQKIYGQYHFILSTLALFSIVSIPGLNTSIAQSIAKNLEGSYTKAVKQSFKWSLIAIPGLLGISIYFFFIKDDIILGYSFLISCFFFPFLYAPNTWQAFLQGKANFYLLTRWQIIENVIVTLTLIVLIYLFPKHFLIILLGYLILKALFNIIFYKKSLTLVTNQNEDKHTINYGWFMTRMSILGILVGQFDKIILGYLDLKLLAIYVIAIKLLETIKSIIKNITSITFPKFVNKTITFRLKHLVLFCLLGMFMAICINIAAKPIVLFLYSEKFIDSIHILKCLSGVAMFYVINSCLGWQILAQKDKKMIFLINVISPSLAIIVPVTIYVYTDSILYLILGKYYFLNFFNFLFLLSRYGKARRKA